MQQQTSIKEAALIFRTGKRFVLWGGDCTLFLCATSRRRIVRFFLFAFWSIFAAGIVARGSVPLGVAATRQRFWQLKGQAKRATHMKELAVLLVAFGITRIHLA